MSHCVFFVYQHLHSYVCVSVYLGALCSYNAVFICHPSVVKAKLDSPVLLGNSIIVAVSVLLSEALKFQEIVTSLFVTVSGKHIQLHIQVWFHVILWDFCCALIVNLIYPEKCNCSQSDWKAVRHTVTPGRWKSRFGGLVLRALLDVWNWKEFESAARSWTWGSPK